MSDPEPLEVIADTPLAHGRMTWRLQPGETSLVFVVKATFALTDGELTLLPEQPPVSGDEHFDDDPMQGLRMEGDFAILKPQGECLVAACCHPPGDAPVPASVAAFSIGAVRKEIAVFGNRRWRGGLLGRTTTDPEPFRHVRIRWERAFGGPGLDDNPIGMGTAPREDSDGESYWPMPNLERRDALLGSTDDRPRPIGFGPIPPTWPARQRLMGTYDARWREERFGMFPADFRYAYFNCAPPDQRIEGYWRGDEPITLTNLVAARPNVQTRLPGIRPRAFLTRRGPVGRFEEIPLVLDTIKVDGERERVQAVWRGLAPVDDEALGDVARLFVVDEPITSSRSLEDFASQLDAALRERALRAAGFVPQQPVASDARTLAFQKFVGTLSLSADELRDGTLLDAPAAPEPEVEPAGEATEAEAARARIDAAMRAAGIDPDALDAAPPPAVGPAPKPTRERLDAMFSELGREPPPELVELVDSLEAMHAAPPEGPPGQPPAAEPEVSSRERVVAAHAAGEPVRGDLTEVDLSGLELPGLDAAGAILTRANLRDAVLRGAKLAGASLTDVDAQRADLREADLTDADLTDARLTAADLSGARLDGVVAERVRLDDATLDGASLRRAELRGAELRAASLVEAVLDEADLTDAVLATARARGASLVDATLSGVNARAIDLTEAVLRKVRLSNGSDLSGALLERVDARGARIRGCTLEKAHLSRADLEDADLRGSDLTSAWLTQSSLRAAVLAGARLTGATLVKADLLGADLGDAVLDDANLRGASLFAAETLGARRAGALTEGADLGRTKWEQES